MMEMPGTEVPTFGGPDRAPPPNPNFHMPEIPAKHSLEALELADLHHPNCKINRKVSAEEEPFSSFIRPQGWYMSRSKLIPRRFGPPLRNT